MLESVAIELCVVIEIVWICKEIVTCTENIATAYIWTGQSHLFRLGNLKTVFRLAVECFAYFVAQVGVGVLVANDLHSVGDTRGTMVGGEHDFVAQGGDTAEHLRCR